MEDLNINIIYIKRRYSLNFYGDIEKFIRELHRLTIYVKIIDPKAVGTQVSGYFSKQLTAAFQGIVLDEPGSNCGTKGHLEILVTPWVLKDIIYNYIIDGNKLVLLDDSNINNYMNKVVKMRSPMFCTSEKLCRVCAGVMFDKLGINNIGLTTAKVSSTMLNLNMKKFHNSTASIKRINLTEITL